MRELSPAAKLKLEELANQPRATGKQRLALLQFQIVVLLILYVVVRIMLKIPWLGRGLSKVVKLSREGPLYKLGVWLCRRLARVTMGRHAYVKPICAPAIRIKKRTATTIEIKIVAVRGRFGNADDVIVESRVDGAWTPLTYNATEKTATASTTPGSSIDIRARASNVRGAGPWSAPLQATALLKPNAFYGGDCGEFSWRQTPETVTCVIELPRGRRDVVVEATRETLTAGLKDVAFFDGARLLRPVAPDARWDIIDGALHITLEKVVPTFRRSDHWDRLFATGPRVDTALLPLSLPSIASG